MVQKRVALLGMHLESNSFAPPTDEVNFRDLCYLSGEAILDDIALDYPHLPIEIPAFHADDKAKYRLGARTYCCYRRGTRWPRGRRFFPTHQG